MDNIEIESVERILALGNIENGKLDISCSNESLLNRQYFLMIYKTDDEGDKRKKVGQIEMTYMDTYMAEETGYSIFSLFDLIDSEKQGVYHYLFEDNEPNDDYVGMNQDIIYIDKIFIEKEYRNLGIGSAMVKELPKLIGNVLKLKPGCVVLLANPFDFENENFTPINDKKKIEKLVKFYEKNGFERIENTQYLVKNMDYL